MYSAAPPFAAVWDTGEVWRCKFRRAVEKSLESRD
jgi:hypothetical protein